MKMEELIGFFDAIYEIIKNSEKYDLFRILFTLGMLWLNGEIINKIRKCLNKQKIYYRCRLK